LTNTRKNGGHAISVLDEAEIANVLSPAMALNATRQALIAVASPATIQPPRLVIDLDNPPSRWLGLMPAASPHDELLGAKIITVYPENGSVGKPTHQGAIILFNSGDGKLEAVLEAELITAYRTAAASAIAIDLLAPDPIEELVVLGSGVQALHHVEMIASLRSLGRVSIWARSFSKAERLADEIRDKFSLDCSPEADLAAAVRRADVLCTTTDARQPLVRASWLKTGIVIAAVGSGQELEDAIFLKSRVFVDHHASVTRLVPEFTPAYRRLIELGMSEPTQIGALLLEAAGQGQSPHPFLVFRSAGIGMEDLFLADAVLAAARQSHLRSANPNPIQAHAGE
jgi:ornithine cyclodeaminase